MEETTANGDHKITVKYRCKLCGAYKQGHICPYRKSLQRTIGVMMCPAVNAYSSVEPGVLIPFLSEMNNFVPYGKTSYDEDNGIDGGHDRGRGGPYDSSDMDTEVASSSREDESTTGSRLTSEGTTKKTNKSHQHQSTHHHHHSPNSSSLSTSTSMSTSSRHSSSKGQHSSSQGESLPSQQTHGQKKDQHQQQKQGQKRRAEDAFSVLHLLLHSTILMQ